MKKEKFDVNVYINHDLKFNNAVELVEAFKNKLNTDVFVEVYDPDPENRNSAPVNYKGWATERMFSQSLNQEFQGNGYMDFYLIPYEEQVLIWFHKRVIQLLISEINDVIHDWNRTLIMFNRLAKLTPEQRTESHFHQTRLKIFDWIKKFDSDKYFMFCNRFNLDMQDDLLRGLSIEEILIKYKNEINVIHYDEIHKFNSISDNINKYQVHRIYAQTILIDDFKDLKLQTPSIKSVS